MLVDDDVSAAPSSVAHRINAMLPCNTGGPKVLLLAAPLPTFSACCQPVRHALLVAALLTLVPAVGLFLRGGAPIARWYPMLYVALSLVVLLAASTLASRHVQQLLSRFAAELGASLGADGEAVAGGLSSDVRVRYLLAALRANDGAHEQVHEADPLAIIRADLPAMSASSCGYVVTNSTGIILWVNGTFCTYFGYDASEVINENIRVTMPAPYSLQHDHFMRKHVQTGQCTVLGRSREVPVVDAAGRQSIAVLQLDHRLDPNDADSRLFVGRMEFRKQDPMVAAVGDQLKGGATPRPELFATFSQSTEPIVVATVVGTIIYANRATSEEFGWQDAELEGQNVKVLMAEPFASAHDGFLRGYAERAQAAESRGGVSGWPQSSIVGSGRDVMAATKRGQRVRVFLMISRLDQPFAKVADCLFVAKMVPIAQIAGEGGSPAASRSPTVRSRSDAASTRAQTVVSRRLGTKWVPVSPLKGRRCTVAVLQSRVADLQTASSADLRASYERLLSLAFQACVRHRGVLQWVIGDRMVCTFNAAAPASSHRANAAAFLTDVHHLLLDDSLTGTLQVGLAAASGEVYCGSWGPHALAIGDLVDRAGVLLRLGDESHVSKPVVDGMLFRDLQYTYVLRLVNRATVWPYSLRQAVMEAYEIVDVREEKEEEWMYQLRSEVSAAAASWDRVWAALARPASAKGRRGQALDASAELQRYLTANPQDATAQWLLEALGGDRGPPGPTQWGGAVPFVMQFRASLHSSSYLPAVGFGFGSNLSICSLHSSPRQNAVVSSM